MMKNVIRDISAKRNLKENLPLFMEYMGGLYYNFSSVRLCMDYYTLYQITVNKKYGKYGTSVTTIMSQINKAIEQCVKQGDVSGDSIRIIENARNRIISKMKVLTAYTDILDRYEYILNRIEYKFSDADISDNYSDEELTRKLMKYITEFEDSVIVNTRISEVIAELPMRMTKSKFFERVNEGISIYKETDKKSLENFLYMVRSSATLELPNEKDDIFGDLKYIYGSLVETDYENINNERYELLYGRVKYGAVYIEDAVNIYMMLQNVINNLYVFLITKQYAGNYGDENDKCIDMLAFINSNFKNKEMPVEVVEEYFVSIEGKQESIHEKIMASEHVLDNIKTWISDNADSEPFREQYDILFKSQVLLSDSLFVEFNGNNIDDSPMDSEYFEQRKRDFLEEIETFFKEHDRVVNRAVMSAIISSLPVFFNNLSELQDYIYNSLDSCRNNAEKKACIEILNSIADGKV